MLNAKKLCHLAILFSSFEPSFYEKLRGLLFERCLKYMRPQKIPPTLSIIYHLYKILGFCKIITALTFVFLLIGKRLKTVDDLQTTACTTPAQKMPKHLRQVIAMIHDEVVSKYYGCG